MGTRAHDYVMTQKVHTRLTTLRGHFPKCACGCKKELNIGDKVHVTSRNRLFLIKHWRKLQH